MTSGPREHRGDCALAVMAVSALDWAGLIIDLLGVLVVVALSLYFIFSYLASSRLATSYFLYFNWPRFSSLRKAGSAAGISEEAAGYRRAYARRTRLPRESAKREGQNSTN